MADRETNRQDAQQPEEELEVQQETAEQAESQEPQEEMTPEAEIAGLKAALEQATQDVAAMKDKYLRQAAEFDNYKRRTQKEKESLTVEVKAVSVKGMLPILDNLGIAIGQQEEGPVREGLEMLLRQCTDALAALGVEPFGQQGEIFDPTIHNAVMHVEEEGLEENSIVEVFQKGYRIGDKIVRHAMVKVAN
ncbi:MAG: nucleotide exchange factor GrpE [Eubacteriales bacterium]|jgi:molecular chaperone GrpE